MEKRNAEKEQNWSEMYVYQSDATQDLMDVVLEYIGECEHDGEVANSGELSSDTVEDMALWNTTRRNLLLEDFCLYAKEVVRTGWMAHRGK